MKALSLFTDLRKMYNECLMPVVSYFGSPDKDENIVLDLKSDAVVHSFYGLVEIKSLTIRNDFKTPELQIKGIDEDGETQIYTSKTLPVEGCIEVIDHVARQFELDDMCKILESYC